MAKIKIVKTVRAVCDRVLNVGRWIGARRFLFVWSAVSFGLALYIGIAEGVGVYTSGIVLDMDIFMLTRALDVVVMFLKLFVPMLMLVVAAKYIFDCDGRHMGRASRTFRLSLWASVFIGLAVASLYYANAGNIIGNNPGNFCVSGLVCWFNWPMVGLAARAFAASAICALLTILGMRGIYTELSFMLSKK